MASVNHLLKGGSVLLSSCTRTINVTHPIRFLPLSLLPKSTSIPTAIRTRNVRRLCTTSEAPAAVDSSSPAVEVATVKETAGLLDIRVGKIIKAWRHPDADTLYVEEVDIGEIEPRTICSGLVNFVPLDHLQDKKVVVLANLKPRNMRGIKSCGMLMAASDASHENVELLVPPEESIPGERIWFGLEDEKEDQPAAASSSQIQKKKVWESVQPHLKTDAACVAMLDGHYMRTSAGPVVSTSLKNANIS